MIFTVDRVQFDQKENLVFFEFYNVVKDKTCTEFVSQKNQSLQRVPDSDLINVYYDDYFEDKGSIRVKHNGIVQAYNWQEYINWFNMLNRSGSEATGSKSLASETVEEGDPFVQRLLQEVHGVDFSQDDNGLAITKAALSEKPTYGFDFDLFDDINMNIIEFLSNETKKKGKNPLLNLQAHPMRYSWISRREQDDFYKKMKVLYPKWPNPRKKDNRQKYISLWKATQKLSGSLYLINYNKDDLNEEISIIVVLGLDFSKGFTSDISYKVKYNELVQFLQHMNTNPQLAQNYLEEFPKQVRDESFWEEYYKDQLENIAPRRGHIGNRYTK